jgi:hypothetical protein
MQLKTQLILNAAQEKAHAYLTGKGFKPIEPSDYQILHAYKANNRLHELSATTCAIWAFAYKALYQIIKGYLIGIWFYRDGETFFSLHRPQKNECSVQEIIDDLYELAMDCGLDALKLGPVEECFLEDYKSVSGYAVESAYNEDMSEYRYLTSDIIKLDGKTNLIKRKILKKFIGLQNIEFKVLSHDNFKLCFEIEQEWCADRDCDSCEFFGSGCAKDSLIQMQAIFDEHIHGGLVGFMDNKPIAYAIWDKISDDIYVGYFAKSITHNFNMFLYYTMVKDYMQDANYFNIGPDMGNEGLRFFKQHLSRYELCGKYLCTFKRDT